MEDIIDIIVTETTNIIEITSQPTDEVIDVNIIDNREDVTLNVTPSVVEININSLTGNFGVNWGDITGTLSNQTDLNTALGLKADLVDGKVPSSQLPSYVDDVVEVATYSALPATGEVGKIYVILDTNKIYRWSGSTYIEIADSTAVWGAITGTLSSQSDLQSALNAKFNNPTGDTTQYIAGDGSLITFPVAGQAGTLVRQVRNTTGATLTKGTIVYINGASGNKPTVTKALATGDSTSAQTFGFIQADLSNNSNGYVVCVGDLDGLDTSAVTEGTQLYLSSTTAGAYTTTKQVAPAHLVYVGVVTRSHPTQGQIEVKIQNGYELDEIHDVLITSKANNDGLFYESSTSLWKNKSIATVLGYTPANGANYLPLTGGTLTGTLNGLGASFTQVSAPNFTSQTTTSNTQGSRQFALYSGGLRESTNNDFNVDLYDRTSNSWRTPLVIANNGGAATFSSSVTATRLILSGGTGNTGLYFGHTDRVVLANYGVGGIDFETNGGTINMTLFPSGNLGIGASLTDDTTNKLQVSGTIKATGATLTGALSGTTITTSGSATFGSDVFTYANGGIFFNGVGSYGSGIFQQSGGTLTLQTGGTPRLTIASTGPATFSSSVTATASIASDNIAYFSNTNTTNGYGVYIKGGATSSQYALRIKNGADADVFYVRGDGNVGIGTTSPNISGGAGYGTTLTILSSSNYGGLEVYGSGSTNGGQLDFGSGSIRYASISGEYESSDNGFINIRTRRAGSMTNAVRITSGGNVLIGTTSDVGQKFVVNGGVATIDNYLTMRSTVNSTNYGFINEGNGLVKLASIGVSNLGQFSMTTGVYTPLSDRNKKKDFEVSNIGLNEVMQLKPTLYRMKSDDSKGIKELGFIAQEVKGIIPNAYQESEDFIGLNFNPIVAALTKAVQEQQLQIEELKQLLNK